MFGMGLCIKAFVAQLRKLFCNQNNSFSAYFCWSFVSRIILNRVSVSMNTPDAVWFSYLSVSWKWGNVLLSYALFFFFGFNELILFLERIMDCGGSHHTIGIGSIFQLQRRPHDLWPVVFIIYSRTFSSFDVFKYWMCI